MSVTYWIIAALLPALGWVLGNIVRAAIDRRDARRMRAWLKANRKYQRTTYIGSTTPAYAEWDNPDDAVYDPQQDYPPPLRRPTGDTE